MNQVRLLVFEGQIEPLGRIANLKVWIKCLCRRRQQTIHTSLLPIHALGFSLTDYVALFV